MKAILKKTDWIYLEDIMKPSLSNGEVLIQVAYAGLCRTDLYIANGKIKTKTPLVLGHEFSGIVKEIHPELKNQSGLDFEIGEKVMVMPISQDKKGYYTWDMLGLDMDWGFAEFVKVAASSVYKIPADMDMKKAAVLEPIAASAAVLEAPIKADMKWLIQWDSRISQLTMDIMKLKGFYPDMLSDLELAEVGDNEYDYVVETFVNNDNIDDIIRVLKPGGILVLKSRSYFPVNIKVAELVKKNISIFAKYYGDIQESIELLEKLDVDWLLGNDYDFQEFTDILKGDIYDESKKLFLKA